MSARYRICSAYVRMAHANLGIKPQDIIVCKNLPHIEFEHFLQDS